MRKRLFYTVFLIGLFCIISGASINAEAATATAKIKIVAVQDDNKTAVTGLSCKLIDLGGNDITSSVSVTNAVVGTYVIENITTKGAFSIEISKGTDKYTFNATVAPTVAGSTVTKRIIWIEKSTLRNQKSGAVGGVTRDDDGNAVPAVKVLAYNTTGTWETISSSNGQYRLYLMPGVYTLVIVGKDVGLNNYKNFCSTVKVVAGQFNGTIDNLSPQIAWAEDAAAFNYSLTPPTSSSKFIKGFANNKCTVSVYSVDNSNKYTYLAAVKVVTSAAIGYGKFTVTLPEYQLGKKLSIKVTDLALNVYEDTTYINTPIPNRDMTLTATTPSALSCTVDTPVVISFKDSSTTVLNAYLAANITTITAVGVTTPTTITLNKTTDFTVSGGKISIKSGRISVAQNYDITVTANGYNNATLTQKVETPIRIAGAISGSFTLVPGTIGGTTKFSIIGTPGSGNSLVYMVVPSTATAQYKDNVLVGTSYPVVVGANIGGMGPTLVKYIDVYEVTASNIIVKYKRVTISTSQIKAPTITSASVTGSAMVLISDVSLIGNPVPVTSAFKVMVGSVSKEVSSVAISGNNITLTLATPVLATDSAITVKYAKPASAYLHDMYGNAILSQSTATSVTNNTTVAVSGVTLDNDTLTVSQTSGSAILVATVNPGDASNKNVTWSSSNTSVATVSNGTITLLSPGTTTITVTTVDGSYTDQCIVTVE